MNLSQEELAEKIYVTRQTISNWENDKSYPDIHSLLLLSSTFHISLAELLGVSRGYAYKVIRGLNDELKAKGFRVISGKVPRKYFQEKYYGMVV